eukprot:scaffold54666_cov68-Phaeocystis_antarctica.AAC.3
MPSIQSIPQSDPKVAPGVPNSHVGPPLLPFAPVAIIFRAQAEYLPALSPAPGSAPPAETEAAEGGAGPKAPAAPAVAAATAAAAVEAARALSASSEAAIEAAAAAAATTAADTAAAAVAAVPNRQVQRRWWQHRPAREAAARGQHPGRRRPRRP